MKKWLWIFILCIGVSGIIFGIGKGNEQREVAKNEVNIDYVIKPKVALTFDDGPHPEYTPKLLDALKERGVKATFFLIGKNAKVHPEIVKRIADEGHVIGNHTMNHAEITKMADADAFLELDENRKLLEGITGMPVEYMRPPFGAWQKSLENKVNAMPVLWSVDPLDWTTENTEEIVRKVIEEVEEDDIILLHDYYESSVEAAIRIVDILQAEGYDFVPIDELILG
ncbi:MAG: polysaccharide deacetylase family protein [Lachnospiraceae bacterium]|nr:polysaccharide deacetylase family protein [Lachnospiraceae bacterium]